MCAKTDKDGNMMIGMNAHDLLLLLLINHPNLLLACTILLNNVLQRYNDFLAKQGIYGKLWRGFVSPCWEMVDQCLMNLAGAGVNMNDGTGGTWRGYEIQDLVA